MIRQIWGVFRLGLIVSIFLLILIPVCFKLKEIYESYAAWAAGITYLNWGANWVVLLTIVFVLGLLGKLAWWFLVIFRFRGMEEVRIFRDQLKRDEFDAYLLAGEYIDEDGETFLVCYSFFDFIPPKGFPHFIKESTGRVERTGRTAEEYIWSVLRCWVGKHTARRKENKKNPPR